MLLLLQAYTSQAPVSGQSDMTQVSTSMMPQQQVQNFFIFLLRVGDTGTFKSYYTDQLVGLPDKSCTI